MPTRRIAAAPARIAASAVPRPPHRVPAQRSTAVPALDLRRGVTDELGDVSRSDDDRIDSRPLELVDLFTARHSHVRDRELARRNVRQELESLTSSASRVRDRRRAASRKISGSRRSSASSSCSSLRTSTTKSSPSSIASACWRASHSASSPASSTATSQASAPASAASVGDPDARQRIGSSVTARRSPTSPRTTIASAPCRRGRRAPLRDRRRRRSARCRHLPRWPG